MFCQIRNRALIEPGRGLHGQPLAAPWWRSLVGSALAAGACRWRVRRSAHSFTGAVVVVGFSNCGTAVAFAAAWSWWVGASLALRRRSSAGGVIWAVSVPVCWPGGRGSGNGGQGGPLWWVAW